MEPQAERTEDTSNVTAFIRNYLLCPGTPFNSTASRGAHNHFIIQGARARGLRVQAIEQGHYFFRDRELIGGIRRMVPSLISTVALAASSSKEVGKALFNASSVPTPRHVIVDKDDLKSAQRFLAQASGPIVTKPAMGRGGDGVQTGIRTARDLDAAWKVTVKAAKGPQPIVVEEEVHGIDVRAYVVGDQVVAAATRIQPFVVGDGRTPLDELIEVKQERRRTNGYLDRMPIIVDTNLLQRRGHSPGSVPGEGQIVILNSASNIHQGGENIDLTDVLHPELKSLAIKAARAIPDLGCGGIDLFVRSPRDPEGAVVLEVNAAGNISIHHVPAYGQVRDVGGAIVAEMVRRHDAIHR